MTLCRKAIPIFLRERWFDLFEQHVAHADDCLRLPLAANQHTGTEPRFIALRQSRNTSRFTTAALHSTANYYSPFYGIANSPLDDEPDLAGLSADSIRQLKQYDSINLVPLLAQQAKSWQRAFEAIGFKAHLYHHSDNWYEPDISNINQYWQRRPSKLKNTIKRKQELMTKTGGFSTQIFAAGTNAEFMTALIDYHLVYQQSWKISEPTPAFIDAICQYAWQQHELRIGVLYQHAQPVAAQIWFVCDKTAYIFKLAYVPGFTQFSPGTVLMAQLLEHVISIDGVNCVDFLTGNDNYKKDWMSCSRKIFGFYFINNKRIIGKLKNFFFFGMRLIKNIKRI